MKRSITFIILLILTVTQSFSQRNRVVTDSVTHEKIPFVNIWIENENIGITSDQNGLFLLQDVSDDKIVVFSALGYKVRRVRVKNMTQEVVLSPKNQELDEVVIYASSNKEITVGKFRKSKISSFHSCSTPWIIARHFPYYSKYETTPWIRSITCLTNSEIKKAFFNVRLLSINEDGSPGNSIYSENIIGVAKKGTRKTKIDLSELHIRFPENGFFVAIEWLIIPSNKNEYEYYIGESKQKHFDFTYEPSIGTGHMLSSDNVWIFTKGKWYKMRNKKNPTINYTRHSSKLAIELGLTD